MSLSRRETDGCAWQCPVHWRSARNHRPEEMVGSMCEGREKVGATKARARQRAHWTHGATELFSVFPSFYPIAGGNSGRLSHHAKCRTDVRARRHKRHTNSNHLRPSESWFRRQTFASLCCALTQRRRSPHVIGQTKSHRNNNRPAQRAIHLRIMSLYSTHRTLLRKFPLILPSYYPHTRRSRAPIG